MKPHGVNSVLVHKWMTEWLSSQTSPLSLEDIAVAWQNEMGTSERTRKEKRVGFCKTVADRAKLIANLLIDQAEWRQIFVDFDNSAVRE